MLPGIELRGELQPAWQELLSPPALALVAHLHRMFEETRQSLLRARDERRHWGAPALAPETSAIRDGHWQVTAAGTTWKSRPWRTVPATHAALTATFDDDAGHCIASLEDAITPSLQNLLGGQAALATASAKAGEQRSLFVQPRGWHLPEAHLLVDGAEVSASIFDFGLHLFHNAKTLLERQASPAFVLPKLEHYLEARLWNNIFIMAQSILGLPLGTIRAAVLIETVPAAYMAEEILYELRDHACALLFDREDYLFSHIKTFGTDAGRLLPDQKQIADSAPLLETAAGHLVALCARRGVEAAGSLAGRTLPSEQPDLARLAMVPEGNVTSAGLAENIFVAIGYLAGWLRGTGTMTINGQPADTATAERCRAQLWQWRRRGAILEDGNVVSGRRLNSEIKTQLEAWKSAVGDKAVREGKYREAATILLDLVLEQELPDFFTLPCYRQFLAG